MTNVRDGRKLVQRTYTFGPVTGDVKLFLSLLATPGPR